MQKQTHPIFEARSVSKFYGNERAVENVTFSLQEGEFLSIIGPSGGGKSTILKMMASVVRPSEGVMTFRGQDLTTMSPGDHRMVMVWQTLALFPHMNVAKNMAFGLAVRNVPKNVQKRKVAESLEIVGLSGYQKRHIQELSGGEQQRVALARALVVEPEMVLLDEPLGALDVHLRLRLLEKLREIHHQTGLTFVMVTHDQAEALYVSTRIAVLSRGKLEQIGTPTQILHHPKTPFVAGFVGRKNLIRGKVQHLSGCKIVVSTEVGEFSATARNDLGAQPQVGMPVVYVVDAHRVSVGIEGDNRITGKLSGRVLDGSRELLELLVPGIGTFKCERANSSLEQEGLPDKVTFSWLGTEAYVILAEDAV